MPAPQEEIEVEVVSIDDQPPPSPAHTPPPQKARPPWQEQALNLHPIWWPAALVLGVILLTLVLTVGLAIAIVFFLIKGLIRLIQNLLGRA